MVHIMIIILFSDFARITQRKMFTTIQCVSATNWFKWFEMRMCGASIGFRYLMGNDGNLWSCKWVISFSRPMAISTSFSFSLSFSDHHSLVIFARIFLCNQFGFGNQVLQRRWRVWCCRRNHFCKFTSVFANKIRKATKWFRIKY